MGKYDDIINLPHHEPVGHPRMSMEQRAAQFSAFKALDGYEEEVQLVDFVNRLEEKAVIDEQQKELIDNVLRELSDTSAEKQIRIIYFEGMQTGNGQYFCEEGSVSKIDTQKKYLTVNKKNIPFDNIYKIQII